MSSNAASSPPSPPDGLPTPRRYWAVAAQLLAIIVTVLDSSIVNVSLPTIARELDASPAQSVWIVNAYNLTLLATLLPFAALGERIGFRRVFTGGLVVFFLAALTCSLSRSFEMLTAARIMQGLGSAAVMSVMGGLMRHIYPRRLLGRGIGFNAMIVGTMAGLGPPISSAILSVAHWPWLFAISVPLSLVPLFGARMLPDSVYSKTRFDAAGAVLSATTLILIVVGVDHLASDTLLSVALIVAGVLTGYVLVRRSGKQTNPLAPVDLFRLPMFSYAVAASLFLFGAQMAAFVSLPFYFQHVLGRNQIEVGFLMTAWPLFGAIMAPVAGRLADRYSAAVLSGIGAGTMVLGLVALILLPRDAGDVWIVSCMALGGIGFGFFQSPNNRAMLTAVPLNRSGAAGGVQATTRTFGQSLGIALVAIAFGISASHGATVAVWFAVVFGLAAAMVNVVRIRAHM